MEFDIDGSRYLVLGKPSDSTGMIRFRVGQLIKADEIHWKYEPIELAWTFPRGSTIRHNSGSDER